MSTSRQKPRKKRFHRWGEWEPVSRGPGLWDEVRRCAKCGAVERREWR